MDLRKTSSFKLSESGCREQTDESPSWRKPQPSTGAREIVLENRREFAMLLSDDAFLFCLARWNWNKMMRGALSDIRVKQAQVETIITNASYVIKWVHGQVHAQNSKIIQLKLKLTEASKEAYNGIRNNFWRAIITRCRKLMNYTKRYSNGSANNADIAIVVSISISEAATTKLLVKLIAFSNIKSKTNLMIYFYFFIRTLES